MGTSRAFASILLLVSLAGGPARGDDRVYLLIAGPGPLRDRLVHGGRQLLELGPADAAPRPRGALFHSDDGEVAVDALSDGDDWVPGRDDARRMWLAFGLTAVARPSFAPSAYGLNGSAAASEELNRLGGALFYAEFDPALQVGAAGVRSGWRLNAKLIDAAQPDASPLYSFLQANPEAAPEPGLLPRYSLGLSVAASAPEAIAAFDVAPLDWKRLYFSIDRRATLIDAEGSELEAGPADVISYERSCGRLGIAFAAASLGLAAADDVDALALFAPADPTRGALIYFSLAGSLATPGRGATVHAAGGASPAVHYTPDQIGLGFYSDITTMEGIDPGPCRFVSGSSAQAIDENQISIRLQPACEVDQVAVLRNGVFRPPSSLSWGHLSEITDQDSGFLAGGSTQTYTLVGASCSRISLPLHTRVDPGALATNFPEPLRFTSSSHDATLGRVELVMMILRRPAVGSYHDRVVLFRDGSPLSVPGLPVPGAADRTFTFHDTGADHPLGVLPPGQHVYSALGFLGSSPGKEGTSGTSLASVLVAAHAQAPPPVASLSAALDASGRAVLRWTRQGSPAQIWIIRRGPGGTFAGSWTHPGSASPVFTDPEPLSSPAEHRSYVVHARSAAGRYSLPAEAGVVRLDCISGGGCDWTAPKMVLDVDLTASDFDPQREGFVVRTTAGSNAGPDPGQGFRLHQGAQDAATWIGTRERHRVESFITRFSVGLSSFGSETEGIALALVASDANLPAGRGGWHGLAAAGPILFVEVDARSDGPPDGSRNGHLGIGWHPRGMAPLLAGPAVARTQFSTELRWWEGLDFELSFHRGSFRLGRPGQSEPLLTGHLDGFEPFEGHLGFAASAREASFQGVHARSVAFESVRAPCPFDLRAEIVPGGGTEVRWEGSGVLLRLRRTRIEPSSRWEDGPIELGDVTGGRHVDAGLEAGWIYRYELGSALPETGCAPLRAEVFIPMPTGGGGALVPSLCPAVGPIDVQEDFESDDASFRGAFRALGDAIPFQGGSLELAPGLSTELARSALVLAEPIDLDESAVCFQFDFRISPPGPPEIAAEGFAAGFIGTGDPAMVLANGGGGLGLWGSGFGPLWMVEVDTWRSAGDTLSTDHVGVDFDPTGASAAPLSVFTQTLGEISDGNWRTLSVLLDHDHVNLSLSDGSITNRVVNVQGFVPYRGLFAIGGAHGGSGTSIHVDHLRLKTLPGLSPRRVRLTSLGGSRYAIAWRNPVDASSLRFVVNGASPSHAASGDQLRAGDRRLELEHTAGAVTSVRLEAAVQGRTFRRNIPLLSRAAGQVPQPAPGACLPSVRFRRGDCNGDGAFDISDAVQALLHLFAGSDVPCRAACNADDSASAEGADAVDVTDAVRILEHLYRNGPAPRVPYPLCGVDPTPQAGPGGLRPRCDQPCR